MLARIAAAAVFAAASTMAAPVPSDVLAAMDAANNYFTGHNPSGDCGWTRGVYYSGSTTHYLSGCANSQCNATLLSWITSWATNHSWMCANSTNANDEACGQAYIDLYNLAPSPEKLALSQTMEIQIRGNDTADWNW
jgi:unsaturated rhamnogalacturonyl hydrolase